MTSIFIWKADSQPPTDCSMVRYDRGADWSLEESGESYQLIRQEKSESYLHYTARRMPTDWMGTCWLESVVIPYHIWKEEDSVRWDQLGIWNRWVGPDMGLPVEEQWIMVQQWCRGEGALPVPVVPAPVVPVLRGELHVPVFGGGRGGGGRGGGGRGGGGRGGGGRGRGVPPHSSRQEYRHDPSQRGRGRGRGRVNIRI